MTTTGAHEVTATRFCRIDSCPNEVRAGAPERGPWANLCPEHHTVEVAKRRAERQAAPSRPRTNGSGPSSDASFEKRAKGLVAVGRRLDRAIARYRPAKVEMEEAMQAWRTICRELAGDTLDE